MSNTHHDFAKRLGAGVSKDRVRLLHHAIKRDVQQKQGHENSLHYFRTFSKLSVCLPPLSLFPDEFLEQFMEAVVDIDMRDDLHSAGVLNWCKTAKPLVPLKTTADGNCLLHAVSQYLWAIEDDDQFLRRLLYVTMTTDPGEMFKKRWIFHQRTSPETAAFGDRIDTQDIAMEWDAAIRATEDVARTGNGGLPYACLESVHLYVLANILQRPIIVLADPLVRDFHGNTLQESFIGGIYLPLDCNKSQRNKNPIVIGYHMNHFAPLVGMKSNVQGDEKAQVVPIVTQKFTQLPLQYLLPEEEQNVPDLIQSYLSLTEVVISGGETIPAVKLQYEELPNDLNIVNEYRIACERKYRNVLDQESGYRVNQQSPSREFNFQMETCEPRQVPKVSNKRRHCITLGCKMYGHPEMANLCTTCFKDFTIQYERQEVAAKKEKEQFPQEFTAPPKHSEQVYHDISMMGEDCQGPRCGFKCSTDTYPYCHECYPMNRLPQVTQQHNDPSYQMNMGQLSPEFSLMPDDCRGAHCTYKASKLTFPYCHECYNKMQLARPTAPPVSVLQQVSPTNGEHEIGIAEKNLQLNIRDDEETKLVNVSAAVLPLNPDVQLPPKSTPAHADWNNLNAVQATEHQAGPALTLENHLGELPWNCKIEGCQNGAIRGNDGLCDKCYDIALFGRNGMVGLPGNEETRNDQPTVCSTPSCMEKLLPGTTQCTACFLQHGQFPCREPAAAIGNDPMPISNADLNILTKMPSELDKNIVTTESRTPQPSLSRSFHGEASQHDEMSNITSLAARRELISYPPSNFKPYRKHICAKPGCQGVRLKDPSGLCFECMQLPNKPAPTPVTTVTRSETGEPVERKSPSSLEETTPIVSCSPYVPTAQETQEMNPVVVSSKQKVKCAAAICDKMIYPPKKLCDSCTEAIEMNFAKKSKNTQQRLSSGSCLTNGCELHGSPEQKGYCSKCYKEKIGHAHRHTAPLAKLTRPTEETRQHTAPILTANNKEYVVSQKCIEIGCERYGDPAQAKRCSQHYKIAIARTPPLSMLGLPPRIPSGIQPVKQSSNQSVYSNKKAESKATQESLVAPSRSSTKENVNRYNTAPTPAPDPFNTAYARVESSRKYTALCKNNVQTGCNLYGNSSNAGYCNTCYPEVRRRQVMLPGQNQIG